MAKIKPKPIIWSFSRSGHHCNSKDILIGLKWNEKKQLLEWMFIRYDHKEKPYLNFDKEGEVNDFAMQDNTSINVLGYDVYRSCDHCDMLFVENSNVVNEKYITLDKVILIKEDGNKYDFFSLFELEAKKQKINIKQVKCFS